MNGITLNDFKAAAGGTPVSQPSVASAVNAVPEYKADEFATQAQAQKAPKKKRVGGIFGSIASVFMKTGVTVKEGTNGLVKGAVQGTALGAVAFGVGSLIEGGVRVGKGELKGAEFIAAPVKALGRAAASVTDVLANALDTRIGDAIAGTVKAPFKAIKSFMSPTYVSRETKNLAFEAREAARTAAKTNGAKFLGKAKAGRTAFNEIMKNPDNLIKKIGGTKTRYIALAVGAAVVAYNIVHARLNINQGRHEVDERFQKTPIAYK